MTTCTSITAVFLKSKNILLLSDIGFLSTVAEFFKRIFKDVELPQVASEDNKESDHLPDTPTSTDSGKSFTLPKVNIKVDANIQDFRVAIIERVDTSEPQALMLKVKHIAGQFY